MKWSKISILTLVLMFTLAVSGMPTLTGQAASLESEYSKLVRVQSDMTSSRGVQTQITLPSATDMDRYYDYINFYLGLNKFEAGISSSPKFGKDANGQPLWRIFVNTTDKGAVYTGTPKYNVGDKVTLKLTIDDATGHMLFFVDGVKVYEDTGVYSSSSNARFVAGAAQSTGIYQSDGSLYDWTITHNQVVFKNTMFKDNSKVWRMANNSNTTLSRPSNPGATGIEYTTQGFNLVDNNGDGDTVDLTDENYFYASLKLF